jgi:hypothetical protein
MQKRGESLFFSTAPARPIGEGAATVTGEHATWDDGHHGSFVEVDEDPP